MTPQQIEAMKLALEALKKCRYRSLADEIVDPAIKAIEKSLAQPEQCKYPDCKCPTENPCLKGLAQPERHELQAKGEHPAPCARHCEANAFKIVIRNLKAQLAQPEQEPVACDGDFPEGFDASLGVPAQALRVANAIMCDVIGKREWDVPCTAQHVLSFAKKYTTPPQRKPLTDEEIINKCLESGFERNCLGWSFTYGKLDYHLLKLARAIEAAHGIKENT